jgi:hypothetical protein
MTQRYSKHTGSGSFNRLFVSLIFFLQHHVRRIKPAMLAILLFLGVAFTFAVKADVLSQTTQTAMLPLASDSAATLGTEVAETSEYVVGEKLEKMEPLPPQEIDTETLWLARVIYSETKEPQEQELVAWVVRNRKDTEYRGKDSYQEVALDSYQFSAFNPGTRTRSHYSSLTPKSTEAGWQNALSIAKQVKEAPDSLRPFTETTRHFFSQQSMRGGGFPNWARGKSAVDPERDFDLNVRRFRFYSGIN